MKKKIFGWIAILLGVALCLSLAFFVRSKWSQIKKLFEPRYIVHSVENPDEEDADDEGTRVTSRVTVKKKDPAKTTSGSAPNSISIISQPSVTSEPAATTVIETNAVEADYLPPPEPEENKPDPIDPSKFDVAPEVSMYTPVAESDYHCYNSITAKQQALYKELREYIRTFGGGGYCKTDFTGKDIIIAYNALLTDYPQYFWAPRTFIYSVEDNIVYFKFNGTEHGLDGYDLDYPYTPLVAERMADQIKGHLTEIFRNMPVWMDEYNRELHLHDWICNKASYAYVAMDFPNLHLYAFNSFGVFGRGSAVCEGYSRSFQLLLYYAGVQNTLVTGFPNGESVGHMWNIVRTDQVWAHVDVTWNDDMPVGKEKILSHRYFNIPASEIRYSRTIDADIRNQSESDLYGNSFNFALPQATTFSQSYYVKQNLYLKNDSNVCQDFTDRIIKAGNEGKKYIEILIDQENPMSPWDLINKMDTGGFSAKIWAGVPQLKGYSTLWPYEKMQDNIGRDRSYYTIFLRQ